MVYFAPKAFLYYSHLLGLSVKGITIMNAHFEIAPPKKPDD